MATTRKTLALAATAWLVLAAIGLDRVPAEPGWSFATRAAPGGGEGPRTAGTHRQT